MANNIITLTRGDTFDFNVTVFEELYGHYYTGTRMGDIIEFALMYPNQPYIYKDVEFDADGNQIKRDLEIDPLPIRQQIIIKDNNPNDECIFYLENSDTKDLPIGVYYYTIKLIRKPYENENFEMQVLTIVNKTKFVLNG